jgi:ribonuclease E
MRLVMAASAHPGVEKIVIEVHDRVGNYLNNRKRKELIRIEDEHEITIVIVTKSDVCLEHMLFKAEDANGREIQPA